MPYTARYIYSSEDFRALMNAVKSKNRYGFWPVRIAFLGIVFFVWGTPILQASLAGAPNPWEMLRTSGLEMLPMVILYAAWELVMFRSSIIARLTYRSCALADGEVTYRLGEKGVSWKREHIRGEYDWPALKEAIVLPDAAVLLTGKREGLVLPARGFASREEFEAAVEFARAKVAAKKAAPEASPGEGSMLYTARYIYSFEEFRALMSAVRSRSRYGFWPARIFMMGVMLFLWGLQYLEAIHSGDPKRLAMARFSAVDLIPPVVFLAIWELIMIRSSIMARLAYKQCALADKEVTYRLGEKGVSWAWEHMRGEYDWPALKEAIARPDAALLLTAKREGLVLPARGFARPEEFEAAVSFARAKIQEG